jgi:hypothetical protein
MKAKLKINTLHGNYKTFDIDISTRMVGNTGTFQPEKYQIRVRFYSEGKLRKKIIDNLFIYSSS